MVNGDVVAGKPHIQACQRHLNDLERQGTDDFPYVWLPEKSEEILDFAETLTIAEGEKPTPLKLYGFQFYQQAIQFDSSHLSVYRKAFSQAFIPSLHSF